jgi:hypothetical protein
MQQQQQQQQCENCKLLHGVNKCRIEVREAHTTFCVSLVDPLTPGPLRLMGTLFLLK